MASGLGGCGRRGAGEDARGLLSSPARPESRGGEFFGEAAARGRFTSRPRSFYNQHTHAARRANAPFGQPRRCVPSLSL